jgi:hypothetical protein
VVTDKREKFVDGSYQKLMTHMFSNGCECGYMYKVDEQLGSIVDRLSLLIVMFVLSASLARHDVYVTVKECHVAGMF